MLPHPLKERHLVGAWLLSVFGGGAAGLLAGVIIGEIGGVIGMAWNISPSTLRLAIVLISGMAGVGVSYLAFRLSLSTIILPKLARPHSQA
jgi:hypothetical protein